MTAFDLPQDAADTDVDLLVEMVTEGRRGTAGARPRLRLFVRRDFALAYPDTEQRSSIHRLICVPAEHECRPSRRRAPHSTGGSL